jgi:hypothetical protein
MTDMMTIADKRRILTKKNKHIKQLTDNYKYIKWCSGYW